MDTIKIRHSMPAGDLLSILPGIRQLYKSTSKKAIIYQRINLSYGDMYGAYMGAIYSIKDEAGIPVTMNKSVFDALYPLLICQEYIEDFKVWDGEVVDYDMDLLRMQDTTMPYGSISRYPFYLFPEMSCDLSEPALTLQDEEKPYVEGKILINRTERYNNMLISYNFLKHYKENVLFVGLPSEHSIFCKQHNINIQPYYTDSFLDLAKMLKKCKLYIGNQSAIFQISEHLKIPRILEVCKPMPNVIGSGKGFYDFINQGSLEYYVDKLFNE